MGEGGTMRVYVPFLLQDLVQCKAYLGSYLKIPKIWRWMYKTNSLFLINLESDNGYSY